MVPTDRRSDERRGSDRRLRHTRITTGFGQGPVYVFVDVGVNRTPMVQQQFNCMSLREAIAAIEETLETLKTAASYALHSLPVGAGIRPAILSSPRTPSDPPTVSPAISLPLASRTKP